MPLFCTIAKYNKKTLNEPIWHNCTNVFKQVVVATDQGDLYMFENLEFRCALATPTTDGAICNLAAFTKGFVTGGANGVLRVFERSDDPREFFKCLKVTTI